ncbi:hypothetical protein ACVRW4_03680 [Streptococcus phocae subsp. phocae]
MNVAEKSSHQKLIQKLLVSIHYLTLFRNELVLVEKTPSILGSDFPAHLVQLELTDMVEMVDALHKQQRLIESTFWYEESAFKLMNKTLNIVDNWIKGVDDLILLCQSKEVFQAILGDKRIRVFGVLIDVFSSLKIIVMSLKEMPLPKTLSHHIDKVNAEEESFMVQYNEMKKASLDSI